MSKWGSDCIRSLVGQHHSKVIRARACALRLGAIIVSPFFEPCKRRPFARGVLMARFQTLHRGVSRGALTRQNRRHADVQPKVPNDARKTQTNDARRPFHPQGWMPYFSLNEFLNFKTFFNNRTQVHRLDPSKIQNRRSYIFVNLPVKAVVATEICENVWSYLYFQI